MRRQQTILTALMSGCAAIMTWSICASVAGQVQTGSTTDWVRGKALQRSGQLPVSVTWTDTPIRTQLESLSRQQRRSIFLDRRVDPTRRLSLVIRDSTTEQIVWQTAAAEGLGVARVGDLLYVGPPSSTSRLPFVIADLKKRISKLPKKVRDKWNRESDVNWPAATSTVEFASWFEQKHGIQFNTSVPNDVWAKGDWPSLSLLEQLSLFLVGFDHSFEVGEDGVTVELIPFPQLKASKLKIRLTRNSKFNIDEAMARFADLKIARSGKTVAVSGPVESLAAFKAWQVKNQALIKDQTVIRTFDLNTTAKRGDILATVATQTGREMVLREGAGEPLVKRITINVQKASLDTLIAQCLEGTGLTYQLSDSKLTILPD